MLLGQRSEVYEYLGLRYLVFHARNETWAMKKCSLDMKGDSLRCVSLHAADLLSHEILLLGS